MLSYDKCLTIIEKTLSELPFNTRVPELYDPIRYVFSLGGKRLRPCLAFLSHQVFSDSVENIIFPAAGIEVFHNFTLLHDDIMDKAPRRRNQETVHIKWNENAAILSGDAMMIMAYNLIAKTQPDAIEKVLETFNKTALQVCEGQQLDMNFEYRQNVSVDEYLEMIRLKTAVLIAASLKIGAITANAKLAETEMLYDLGINIGTAFQLQDDYLDVYATTEKFGKSIGGDILANKKTFLLISALNSDDRVLVEKLNDWLMKTSYNPQEKIKAITGIFNELEVDKLTYNLTNQYFNRGMEILASLPVESIRKAELEKIIKRTMKRES